MEVTLQGSNLSEARAVNKAKSLVPVTVECLFKESKLLQTTVDKKRKMYVGESPVGAFYLATMLLNNMRNCVYPNTVSQFSSVPLLL